VGLEDVSRLPRITALLLGRGYSAADVKKILGGNFLRVFRKVIGRWRLTVAGRPELWIHCCTRRDTP
jgi:hypothetical protein